MTEQNLKRQLIKQRILDSESLYDKAIRMKHKLAISKDHHMKISRAHDQHLEPTKLCIMYPKTFKVCNGYVTFNMDVEGGSSNVRQ